MPVSFTEMVSSRRPLCLKRLATSPDSMAPAERSTLRIGSSILTGCLDSSAGLASSISLRSSTSSIGCFWRSVQCVASGGASGLKNTRLKSSPRAFQCSISSRFSSKIGIADDLVEYG